MNDMAERFPEPGYRIGEWLFSPSANELRRGDERRRLEHRAARTLELLCRRRGDIVSQEEIVREVWNGRAISANSVPVVISDLRQALRDDARDPRHIETVAKRGYRLLADPPVKPEEAAADQPTSPGPRRAAIALACLALLAVALLSWAATRQFGPPRLPLIVGEVENATGRPSLQPLATAATEVILREAQPLEGIQVFRDAPRNGAKNAVILDARLIIWKGRPTVMMSAREPGGAVVWTGMTSGDEARIPPEVARAMVEMGERLRTKSR